MGGLVGLALGLAVPDQVWAQDTSVKEDVIARYEQILERAPVEGPSFDKLLQIYQEGDGLEKLDARWTPMSAQPGAKGATYSLLRGLLADRMGKTDDARKYLQAATQAAPDDFYAWMALGDFEVRQGRWSDAITALQKGLATPVTGDDRLSLYRKLGQAQERNLDLPAALATWQKMVEEFPKDSFALEEAGTAELDSEQFDEAKKTFQKLVDLTEPNSMNRVQALMRLAEVDDRQGKTEAAVHGYEAILPLTAESSWLNRELRAQIEQVYRRQDDLAGLVTYYQKWTQDNPKDVEALLLLSATLTELGKKNDALDVLRKVTILAPDRHEVRQSFAQALVEAKQYDEAITVLTALTADDPTEPRYWETMGDALWLKTQPPTPESKKAVLDAWGHIAPPEFKDVAAILEVADLCREHNLNDEALAGYQRALSISPDASDIREKAVKLLVDLKRTDEAWKLLDQMTDGNLGTAANYLKLATLDQQFDRKDAAAAAVQKGLAFDPKNFDLLSMEWSQLAEAQKWSDCVALFDQLITAAPNAYFIDQLEARQLQALGSAGTLEDTEKKLKEKLGADPGLTENELRMLLRIMIQQSDGDIPKAFDEAHRRFPQSVSLIRIEIDYNRHIGNDDAAVVALEKLVQTVPQQKADWLGEIVHVRQDQGNLDEALKAAQQIIDASPASADGYLLYAEIAFADGKTDDAVAKLQAAIKLSDKPNDVRQRLARYYLEAGQGAKARAVYDDAFTAADNPQDKLAMVRAMTAAYFQDGQIDELINRFKKEQSSEEGGWRYGLYLSTIYEQMEDYGAARRELAKSLAVRPQDTGLLHSLIGLADKEGDRGELLRYREMLAEADPSPANEMALANEYATQDKPEEAWHVVQKNQADVVKDPLGWKDVLNQITNPEYSDKIKGVLEEAIRAKGDSFEGKFALVQFQMQQDDLEGAKKTLWEIMAQPLPPAPPPQAAPTTKSPLPVVVQYGFFQDPLFRRTSQSYMAINEAQQLLAPQQARNQLRQMNMVRIYSRMGISTTLDPAAIKDHALIYLSVIAVQQKQAEDFLKDLEAKFEAWHLPVSEKLVAYTLIQAREPLLATIEEQAKSGRPDKDVDKFAYMVCQQFASIANDDAMRKRAQAAQDILEARLTDDPSFKNFTVMSKISQLAADQSPEGIAKRNVAVNDYLKTVDRKDPEALLSAIGLCAQVGNWAEIAKAVNDLKATDPNKWSVSITQQLGYLPMNILQQATTTKQVIPKEVIPVVFDLMKLGYPATPPRPTLPGTSSSSMAMNAFYNQNTFPPANRFFPVDRVGMLEPLFQQLKARDMMTDVYAALDQQEAGFTDWRKIYPELLRVYFQWWDGKHDDAIASVRKLLEHDPSDDWRLLLASMLSLEQKYSEAIPVLESVTARYGPDYIRTQKDLLHNARLAKDDATGQKAGLRLLALRLPQQDQMQILDDLRNVGLKDKADEIVAKQSKANPGGNAMAAAQANSQLMRTMMEAMNQNNETLACDLAGQVLKRDPLAQSQFGNESYLRTQAINALKKFGRLESYTQEIEKQLETTPDSVRLNWLAGEAYASMPDVVRESRGLLPGYHWLKLQRTGKKFELFYSLDGTTWNTGGEDEVDLPPKLYIGTWVLAMTSAPPTHATFDQIALTGKVSMADAAPPAVPPPVPVTPSTGAVTNAAPVAAPPAGPAPAPWQQTDIGKETAPGTTDPGSAANSLMVTGALSGEVFSAKNDTYHFVYQMLDGDGSIVARISDIYAEPDNTNCGLIMRESLDPTSRGVGTSVSRRRGVVWQVRATAGVPWTYKTHHEFLIPGWMKLARAGKKIAAAYSSDGLKWSEIFSRQAAISSTALAGLFVRTDQSDGKAAWSEVKVNGTAVTPAAGGIAPAPWQETDIGTWANPGKVSWTATGLEMNAPSGIDSDDDSRPFGGYLYEPFTGDGEIIARLDDLTPPKSAKTVSGLSFRDTKEVDSPDFHFVCASNGEASFFFKTDAQARSIQYFKRVAELDPKNQTVLVNLAEQLRQAKKPGAAADLYASILKSDFNSGMTQYYNVVQAFQEANRLPELIKIIEDWTSPPLNPMGGGGMDMYSVLIQVAGQLKQNNHLPEAERVYRKALTVDSFQSKQDGVASLVEVLMDENRRDDAGAEIEKWMTDKITPATPAPAPILGFNIRIQNQAANWLQSMGWSQNGILVIPMIRFLELADDLGLSAKLQQELKAKMAKNPPAANGGQIDQDRMTLILLAIIARDPGYRPDVEKMLKDYPASTLQMGVNANAFLILAQQLEKWPEERPMALRLIKQVYEGMSSNGNNIFFQNIAGLQTARIAISAGDHKTAQDTLRHLGDSLREQRALNGNQIQLEQALIIVRWMLREGMLKEASALLADLKTDPQLNNGNTYYQQKIDQIEKEIAFAKGESSPVALVYGLAEGEGKAKAKGTVFFWQINAGEKVPNNVPYFSNTSWMEGVPVRPTDYKIEVSGGPDKLHLAHIASFENVSTRGSAAIKIPAGMQVVQAMLQRTKPVPLPPGSPTPSPAQVSPVSAPAAVGHVLPLGTGDNLLKNPDFIISRDPTGKAEIVGWKGLATDSVSHETGGPLPSGGYESLEVNNGNFGGAEIVSERISIQPNTDYVCGGWMRFSGNIQFRYLNADGKVLNNNESGYGGNEDDLRWRSWIFAAKVDGAPEGALVFPPGTAFMEIAFKPNQDCDLAGLAFRVQPVAVVEKK